MSRDIISNKQAISLMILFISGSSLIVGTGKDAGRDIWFSTILAFIFSIFIILIYARILVLFPGKDLFDIVIYIFGNIIGKFISFLYVWFALFLVSLVLIDIADFITIIGIGETPKMVVVLLCMLLLIWIVKEGIKVLGRWSELIVIVLVVIAVMILLLQIPLMNINNLRPFLYYGIKPVIKGAVSSFTFPFAETVLFMLLFDSLKERKDCYKVYIIGLNIGGIMIFIYSVSEILVLGENAFLSSYFPAYLAVSRINLTRVFQRIEVIVSTALLIGAFVKMSVCLLGGCKGIGKIFNCNDYRFILTPVSILITIIAITNFESIMEFAAWNTGVWVYYAIPFQVIIPIIILVFAEIKKRRKV